MHEPADNESETALESIADMHPVLSELAELRRDVGRFESLISRLHAENESLNRGQLDRIVEPIFRDLVKVADDYGRLAVSWESGEQVATAEVVAGVCRGVTEDVAAILERHGVEALKPASGEVFDRRLHRSRGTEPAHHPEDIGKVARTKRIGYRIGTRVLQFPDVVLYGDVETSPVEPPVAGSVPADPASADPASADPASADPASADPVPSDAGPEARVPLQPLA